MGYLVHVNMSKLIILHEYYYSYKSINDQLFLLLFSIIRDLVKNSNLDEQVNEKLTKKTVKFHKIHVFFLY